MRDKGVKWITPTHYVFESRRCSSTARRQRLARILMAVSGLQNRALKLPRGRACLKALCGERGRGRSPSTWAQFLLRVTTQALYINNSEAFTLLIRSCTQVLYRRRDLLGDTAACWRPIYSLFFLKKKELSFYDYKPPLFWVFFFQGSAVLILGTAFRDSHCKAKRSDMKAVFGVQSWTGMQTLKHLSNQTPLSWGPASAMQKLW